MIIELESKREHGCVVGAGLGLAVGVASYPVWAALLMKDTLKMRWLSAGTLTKEEVVELVKESAIVSLGLAIGTAAYAKLIECAWHYPWTNV